MTRIVIEALKRRVAIRHELEGDGTAGYAWIRSAEVGELLTEVERLKVALRASRQADTPPHALMLKAAPATPLAARAPLASPPRNSNSRPAFISHPPSSPRRGPLPFKPIALLPQRELLLIRLLQFHVLFLELFLEHVSLFLTLRQGRFLRLSHDDLSFNCHLLRDRFFDQ
jgi:hypothetical protein